MIKSTGMKFLCLVLLAMPAFSQLTTDQKVFDFQALAGLYAKHYAPYDWKRQLFGFDAFNISPWLDRVRATDNDLDFYELMNEYVSDLNDGHDAFQTPSNFSATLGLSVDVYDGLVLIDGINRTLLPQAQYPFAVGDELVSVDGAAAGDLLDAFAQYARYGNPRSTRRMAAARIVTRPQSRMPHAVDLPDTATVAIRRASGAQETYTIKWTKSGVPLRQIDPVPTPALVEKPFAGGDPDPAGSLLLGLQTAIDPNPSGVLGYGSLAPVFTLPQGFARRLGGAPATDYFYSGTYPANSLKIGYLRIPSYSPPDTTAALAQFAGEIAYFQDNTDGLVVDEMRNPGGTLCYGESIVSYLMRDNWRPLGYAIRATREYLQSFGTSLQNTKNLNNQTLVDAYQAIYDSLNASYTGSQRITDPVPICTTSFDRRPALDSKGNVIAYTKPIIMLIDEFSVSTADSVPAMIQDNGRGPLVGWRTNGMGGSNSFTTASYQVGAYAEGSTGMTLSLMVRKNAIVTDDYIASPYIENIGVRPDIPIDYMTRDNLVNGGRTFVQAFSDAIVGEIQKSQ